MTAAKLGIGLIFSGVLAAFVILLLAAWQAQERKRSRDLSRLEKEMTGEAERCVMDGVGDGRVCRLCGQHADQHLNGRYHREEDPRG